ncbi:uncharacterized protein CLUP02_10450 [Colletotrichum lupini]|uniref:Uncharacterized protein n=1 Tax=Colletotrichum lupini TaxID=145971 RepID=A0A9Q8WIS8_9PEZI|nr:uncharacterized protein CLUP02_10450 [Colletotrichum lupini]UQC84954.1 hypothetical protein CLUP02_10450 [Colletotrichum lupini]
MISCGYVGNLSILQLPFSPIGEIGFPHRSGPNEQAPRISRNKHSVHKEIASYGVEQNGRKWEDLQHYRGSAWTRPSFTHVDPAGWWPGLRSATISRMNLLTTHPSQRPIETTYGSTGLYYILFDSGISTTKEVASGSRIRNARVDLGEPGGPPTFHVLFRLNSLMRRAWAVPGLASSLLGSMLFFYF